MHLDTVHCIEYLSMVMEHSDWSIYLNHAFWLVNMSFIVLKYKSKNPITFWQLLRKPGNRDPRPSIWNEQRSGLRKPGISHPVSLGEIRHPALHRRRWGGQEVHGTRLLSDISQPTMDAVHGFGYAKLEAHSCVFTGAFLEYTLYYVW